MYRHLFHKNLFISRSKEHLTFDSILQLLSDLDSSLFSHFLDNINLVYEHAPPLIDISTMNPFCKQYVKKLLKALDSPVHTSMPSDIVTKCQALS